MKERTEFLGHVVDSHRTRPSPGKTKAMVNTPEPTVGMVLYYGKSGPNLATLTAPLNELRRKEVRPKRITLQLIPLTLTLSKS